MRDADGEAPDLGHAFRDRRLLLRAFTHSSYVNENPEAGASNEVLEYLGDAVLDMVVAEILVARLPEASEGTLTRLRAALVAETCLAQVAREIDLGRYLRLGKGEVGQGGRDRPALLADALEAVIGAVHRDGGVDASRALVARLLGGRIERVATGGELDPKSRLQETVQALRHVTPSYRVLRTWGPDHERQFEVACVVGDDIRGIGVGRSKKEAAVAAAMAALQGEAPPRTPEDPAG